MSTATSTPMSTATSTGVSTVMKAMVTPEREATDDATHGTTFDPVAVAQLAGAVALSDRVRDSEDPGSLLYQQWYAAAPPIPSLGPAPGTPPRWGVPLAGALRQAHPLAGTWRRATVRAVDPKGQGAVVVQDDLTGAHQVVAPPDLTRAQPRGRAGLTLAVGESVLVAGHVGGVAGAGWWRTWSPAWSPLSPPPGLTRIYLAPAPEHYLGMVRGSLSLLGRRSGPWLLKAAIDPSALRRPDRVVVYLPDQDAAALLPALLAATRGRLDDTSPPLTRRVAPGLAWAHDGGDGRSFGQARCELIARALGDGPAEPLAAIARAFVGAGLDPRHPHLRPRETSGAA